MESDQISAKEHEIIQKMVGELQELYRKQPKTKSVENKKAARTAVYMRSSLDDFDYATEVDRLMGFAASKEYRVLEVFADKKIFGGYFWQMLCRVMKPQPDFDIILVSELSRLSRDVYAYFFIKSFLDTYGVELTILPSPDGQ